MASQLHSMAQNHDTLAVNKSNSGVSGGNNGNDDSCYKLSNTKAYVSKKSTSTARVGCNSCGHYHTFPRSPFSRNAINDKTNECQ